VVLIGDAAHANPPNVAQGAAMGIEHAVVLAEEATAPGAFEDAMTHFMARRWSESTGGRGVPQRGQNQVEHTPGFDAAAEIGRASARVGGGLLK